MTGEWRLGLCTVWTVAAGLSGLAPADAQPARYFGIQVTDDQTRRGVPLVELRTVDGTSYFTDSNGIVALDDPVLMGHRVFLFVTSPGYEYPKDGFGYAGVAFGVRPGGRAEVAVKRLNIAERLYRVTGAGIYRDTVLLGRQAPIEEPLLNAQVAGQDSVLALPWRGRIYWFFGDTSRPAYPLGLFHTSGATSTLPGNGGLAPSVGIDLTYFVDETGFSRAMCPLPGEGPVWLDGLAAVPGDGGEEQLVAHYSRVRGLEATLEHGLAVFDEAAAVFRKHTQFDLSMTWQAPRGHPFRFREADTEYLLFATPFVHTRARANLASLADQTSYESYTCLMPGTRYEKGSAEVERGPDGKLVWGWKRATDPVTQQQERELLDAGTIHPDEAVYQVCDLDTGKPILMHAGSIAWNDFRRKWIMIAVQSFGETSFLGEVWFTEAGSPMGPWRWAKRIVTHNRYSFYNPLHHPFFDQDGGRLIYFQGTYSRTFEGDVPPTPRYDYNQMMYRLDLSDPRLPQPLAPAP